MKNTDSMLNERNTWNGENSSECQCKTWEDVSDKGSEQYPFWICRTHFEYKDYFWSVIHGFGSYGGISTWNGFEGSLLEVMSNAINHGEPLGSCTAEEIWTIMLGVKNGKRKGAKHNQ